MSFRAAGLVIGLALLSPGGMIRARATGWVPGEARHRCPTVLLWDLTC